MDLIARCHPPLGEYSDGKMPNSWYSDREWPECRGIATLGWIICWDFPDNLHDWTLMLPRRVATTYIIYNKNIIHIYICICYTRRYNSTRQCCSRRHSRRLFPFRATSHVAMPRALKHAIAMWLHARIESIRIVELN